MWVGTGSVLILAGPASPSMASGASLAPRKYVINESHSRRVPRLQAPFFYLWNRGDHILLTQDFRKALQHRGQRCDCELSVPGYPGTRDSGRDSVNLIKE